MRLIVCETTGDWAALARRNLPVGVVIMEVRSLEDLWETLRSASTAVVALELNPRQGEKLLAALRRLNREFREVLPVVLAGHGLADWEEIVREAGAVEFVSSPRQIDRLAALVSHRLKSEVHISNSNADPPLEERIMATLPWGD